MTGAVIFKTESYNTNFFVVKLFCFRPFTICDWVREVSENARPTATNAACPTREKATAHNNFGMALMLNRDYDLAEECFRSALAMRRRLFGDTHNEVAVILLNLARLYQIQAEEIMMGTRVETQT